MKEAFLQTGSNHDVWVNGVNMQRKQHYNNLYRTSHTSQAGRNEGARAGTNASIARREGVGKDKRAEQKDEAKDRPAMIR